MTPPDQALWSDKALLALHGASKALADGNLPTAASRGYYSLYAAVSVLLIEAGMEPPVRGNWTHVALPSMIRQHYRGPFHMRRLAMMLLDRLYKLRLLADYGDHRRLDADELSTALRQLGQMVGSG
jgi:uncharacterized protein (UPF0332 family)